MIPVNDDKDKSNSTSPPYPSAPEDVETLNNFAALQEMNPVTDNKEKPTNVSPSNPPVPGNNEQANFFPPGPGVNNSPNDVSTSDPLNSTNKTTRDDIIILIDLNGKYIDTTKLSRDKQTRKLFCATIMVATKTITDSVLDRPSHIIIHVGTNDIEHSSVDFCSSKFQSLVEIAPQKYPSSKILISSLLKRCDATDHRRSELNSKLGSICAPFLNVHLVNNENVPIDCLYDNKHLKRRKIGALVANLKDVIYNRIGPPMQSGAIQKPIPPLFPRPPLQAQIQQPTLSHPPTPSRAHLYPSQASYASVAEGLIRHKNHVTHLLKEAKSAFLAEFIDQNADNQGKLFRAMKDLIVEKNILCFSDYTDKTALANDLGKYFVQKVTRLRNELDQCDVPNENDSGTNSNLPISPVIEAFVPLSEDDVRMLIANSKSTLCCLDPIPTPLLKSYIEPLIPVITRIINISLESGIFPEKWKEAVVIPLLKKSGLDSMNSQRVTPYLSFWI
ncbi:hypothetical protein ACROYT_G014561 [Oculina patagonica]